MFCAALAACGGAGDPPLWGDAPVEPLDLRAELSVAEVPLLEEVLLRLDLYAGPGLEVQLTPAPTDGYSMRSEDGRLRPLGEGTWRRIMVWIQPTRVGEITIAPFELRAGADGPVATTSELTLVVTSLLGEASADVEAPAPPFPPRSDPWPWLVGALVIAALAVAIWLWLRRRVAPQERAGTPIPPHVKARRALGRLRNAPRSTPAQVEDFYVEVSQILRVYLEERYGMHAPDRTTEEFLAEVEFGDALDAEQRASLRPFLLQCDLVKFARALPGEDVHTATFDTAEQFVEATREDRLREGAA